MSENPRIEELRRRVFKDPTSIAFAQLAEEYRRSGRFQEAIDACEAGLAHHPGYLSARVTLGRSLLETGQLDAAQLELQQVLRAAPENLAALRGLAEVHHRRGDLREALTYYRQALELSRHDPELEHVVEEIRNELEPAAAHPKVVDGLSFEEVRHAFLNLSLPEPASAAAPVAAAATPAGEAPPLPEPLPAAIPGDVEPVSVEPDAAPEAPDVSTVEFEPIVLDGEPARVVTAVNPPIVTPEPEPAAPSPDPQIDELQRWLDTIMAERARPHE